MRRWREAAAAPRAGTPDGAAPGIAGEARPAGEGGRPSGPLAPIDLPSPRPAAGRALGETILARGSTREFSGEPIAREQLSDCLYHATRGFPADAPVGLVDLYVTVHAVEGITPGAYAYRPVPHQLEPIRLGDFRRESAFLCLEQPLGGTSSATVFFLADLGRILDGLGNRGYRLANLEAGLIGGRLYLGAYAQRFGATGLTFYDRAVVEFFSPHAAGKDAVFVTALGRAARRAPLRRGRSASVGPIPDPADPRPFARSAAGLIPWSVVSRAKGVCRGSEPPVAESTTSWRPDRRRCPPRSCWPWPGP